MYYRPKVILVIFIKALAELGVISNSFFYNNFLLAMKQTIFNCKMLVFRISNFFRSLNQIRVTGKKALRCKVNYVYNNQFQEILYHVIMQQIRNETKKRNNFKYQFDSKKILNRRCVMSRVHDLFFQHTILFTVLLMITNDAKMNKLLSKTFLTILQIIFENKTLMLQT